MSYKLPKKANYRVHIVKIFVEDAGFQNVQVFEDFREMQKYIQNQRKKFKSILRSFRCQIWSRTVRK